MCFYWRPEYTVFSIPFCFDIKITNFDNSATILQVLPCKLKRKFFDPSSHGKWGPNIKQFWRLPKVVVFDCIPDTPLNWVGKWKKERLILLSFYYREDTILLVDDSCRRSCQPIGVLSMHVSFDPKTVCCSKESLSRKRYIKILCFVSCFVCPLCYLIRMTQPCRDNKPVILDLCMFTVHACNSELWTTFTG